MLVHKLNSPVIGALLAISVAAATVVAVWKRQSTTYPLGIKGDRLDVVPRVDCPQVAWPFGCDWQQQSALPDTKKHSRFGRRGRRLGPRSYQL